MPLPAPIEMPEAKAGNLLDDLVAEPRTTAIAQLAKRIIAALNIPVHAQGSSDKQYGGVSDITNRGNLDRLLLSELAYDDNILLARLANNEALYLRREDPPTNPKNKRIILLDTTIKMWGMPRLFAMSAAIACALDTKHHEEVETHMLGGSKALPADTTSVKGVIQALELLDHSLDCCEALANYCATLETDEKTDVILITQQDLPGNIRFQKVLSDNPAAVSFLISIGRDGGGEMQLSEVSNGRIKLLSKAKFEIEEILSFQGSSKKKVRKTEDLPDFFRKKESPLLFPTTLRFTDHNCIYDPKLGVVAVTDTYRLLHWASKDKGAKELLDTVEPGRFSFGFDGLKKIFLLVNLYESPKVILYSFDAAKGFEERFEITTEKKSSTAIVVYHDNYFYMPYNASANSEVAIINCQKGIFEGSKKYSLCAHIFKDNDKRLTDLFRGNIKRHVNNGYNVLHQFSIIAISLFGNISIGNKVFTIPAPESNYITIRPFEHKYRTKAYKDEETYTFNSNDHCKLTFFTWAEGSKAIIDSRGFIHIVSSDAALPEISMVLIQGKATACWSSDSSVAGNSYFLPSSAINQMSPVDFYNKYIVPILKRIDEA